MISIYLSSNQSIYLYIYISIYTVPHSPILSLAQITTYGDLTKKSRNFTGYLTPITSSISIGDIDGI